jgi:hypothetical protein
MFRTPTGQTGTDAYVYEAAQIANAQRELDARMQDLLTAMHTEQPDLFHNTTDFAPQWARATSARNLLEYLQGEDHYRQWLRQSGVV